MGQWASLAALIISQVIILLKSTIIAIEKERYSLSLELAFQIALVFGVLLEEVFSYDVEDESK